MPKLTNEDYLKRHDLLAQLWETDSGSYSHLNYQQQHDLHNYYVPTKQLSELELRAHRRKVSKQDHSLPQRASRAFRALEHSRGTSARTCTWQETDLRPTTR
jgi:hypothetical protein